MFSKACKYGIRAVLFMAVHATEGRKISVDELVESLDVPKHFLAKILQELVRLDLVSSKKGPGGGFFLSEKNLEAPLLGIVVALDGSDLFNSCILGFDTCGSENPCPLHMQAYGLREGLRYQLANYSIKNLATQTKLGKFKL